MTSVGNPKIIEKPMVVAQSRDHHLVIVLFGATLIRNMDILFLSGCEMFRKSQRASEVGQIIRKNQSSFSGVDFRNPYTRNAFFGFPCTTMELYHRFFEERFEVDFETTHTLLALGTILCHPS